MKKLFLSILLIFLLFTYINGSSYEENSGKKANFILMNMNIYLNLKGFVHKLANREFFLRQNLDFISKSTLLYEQLKSIEIYINKIFLNFSNKVDKYWIGYLKDSGIINGAVIYNNSEMYIIGSINANIDKKEGFHIVNNSLYYYVYDSKKGIKGKFSIRIQYLQNNLNYDLKLKENNLIINSAIVEGPETPKEDARVSSLILYSNIKSQKHIKGDNNSFFSIKTNKEYSKLLRRKFIIGLNRVTYIKKLYFNKDTVLIFLTSYRNRITANYIYSFGLLIAVLIDIFLLLLIINNIFVKRKGGKIYMGDTEEEKERVEGQLNKQKQENNLIEEEDAIQEIDNEVSKIILEENLESETDKKTNKGIIEEKPEAQLQIEEEKKKRFEELKRDGIIIK